MSFPCQKHVFLRAYRICSYLALLFILITVNKLNYFQGLGNSRAKRKAIIHKNIISKVTE